MALSATTSASMVYQEYNNYLQSYSESYDFLNNIIATELDRAFQNDGVLTPNFGVFLENVAGTLHFDHNKSYYSSSSTYYFYPDEIAKKVSEYFVETVLTSGVPQYDTILAVSNTASSIYQPLYADLVSLPESISLGNNFERFFEIVYSHVQTIVWTVNEVTKAMVPQTYTVMLV